MIYLIRLCDEPNTALQNRFVGFSKGLKKLGVKFRIVFVAPGSSLSHDPALSGFDVHYLWRQIPFSCNDSRVRLFWYRIWTHLLCKFTFCRFCRTLNSGDVVIVFDGYEYVHRLIQIPGLSVFMERTEHPEVVGRFKTQQLMMRYLDDCRHLDGLFVISHHLKTYFESIGVAPERIHVVNMIVDASRLDGVVKQPVKDRYIAYCGTVSNNKDGVDYLIRSFAIVSKRVLDVKLYIIGSIPSEEDRANNMRLIDELGIKERVVLTGMIPAKEMPQMLVNAEVSALARPDSLQAQSGFPTKLGEYLLSKNPVVITKTGDIPTFLEDGGSALLCQDKNVEEFADKLIWTLEHPEEAKVIGMKGYNEAIKNFNSQTESRKIYDVITRNPFN